MPGAYGGYVDGLRLYIEATRTSQRADREDWRIALYVEKRSTTWDHYGATWSIAVTSAHTRSGSYILDKGSTWVKIGEFTTYWTRNYGQNRTITATGSSTSISNRVPPSASVSWTVAARPYEKPAAPTGVSASRVNDSQIKVEFTTAATTAAPVAKAIIERAVNGGSWTKITEVTGSGAKSWIDTGVSAGKYYRYRVAANGAGGTSGTVATSLVYLTPLAPSSVTASKDASNNIVLRWVNRAVGEYQTRIYEGAVLVATLGAGAASFTVPSPDPLAAHTYTLKAVTPDGLESVGAVSPVVRLAAAPFAPTNLAPNGAYAATGSPVVLSWQHNPADLSAQSKAEIQYATNPTSPSWSTLATVRGDAATYSWAAAVSPVVRVWRVRTWGQDASKPSPWSSAARVDVVAPPTVAITSPASGAVIDKDTVMVSFSTSSVAGGARFEASISPAPSTGSSTVTGGFTNRQGSVVFSGLENGTTYTVSVRAGDYVWSAPVARSFTVTYAAPPTFSVLAAWDASTASVLLGAVELPADYTLIDRVDYQRRVDGGQWEAIVKGVAVTDMVVDSIPPLDGVIEYRAVTYSNLGVPAFGQPSTIVDAFEAPKPQAGVWINWGAGFTQAAGLFYNISYDLKPVKEYVKDYWFAGRAKPTVLMGVQVRRTVAVSAYLGTPGMKIAGGKHNPGLGTLELVGKLRELAASRSLVTVRSPRQPTITGYLDGFSLPRSEKNEYQVSFTVTESD